MYSGRWRVALPIHDRRNGSRVFCAQQKKSDFEVLDAVPVKGIVAFIGLDRVDYS